MRNLELEKEMTAISLEVWRHFDTDKKFPKIESKQGGSTGCYYPDRHTVYYRWNCWNKMPLAGKRMLAIHELYHATGADHKGMFCHSFDILTLELYKYIYGEDEEYKKAIDELDVIARQLIRIIPKEA